MEGKILEGQRRNCRPADGNLGVGREELREDGNPGNEESLVRSRIVLPAMSSYRAYSMAPATMPEGG